MTGNHIFKAGIIAGLLLASGLPRNSAAAPEEDSPLAAFSRSMEESGKTDKPFTVVFDLDDTLVDPSKRLAVMLEDFVSKEAVQERLSPEELRSIQEFQRKAEKDPSILDYDLSKTLAKLSVGDSRLRAQARVHSALNFGKNMDLDEVVPGAGGLLERAKAVGAVIVYVSDRSESMREATLESLKKLRFPLPDGEGVRLFLSPRLHDRGYKKRAYQDIREELPPVLAGFENDSAHSADFAQAFPEARNFFLTTRNPSKEPLPEGAIQLRSLVP